MSDSQNIDKAEGSCSSIRQYQREQLKVFRREQSDQVLNRIRGDIANLHSDISINEIQQFGLKLQESKKKLDVLRQIRIGLSFGEDCVKAFLSTKVALHQLTSSLRFVKDPESQLEAAACLTNIVAYNHEFSNMVAKKAGPHLIASMFCSSHELQGQCAWTVGSICNDCEECFLILKEQGLLPALITLLESPHSGVLESITGALLACTKYDDPDIDDLVNTSVPDLLMAILKKHSSTPLANANAMFCLSNICCQVMESKLEKLQNELREITLLKFIDAVLKKDDIDCSLATACVRCLGIEAAFNDEVCWYFLSDFRFGQCATKILESSHPHLKKEFLWALSNILVPVPTISNNTYLDWKRIVISIKPLVCLLDNKAILALYLLCHLAAKNDGCRSFINDCLSVQVEVLRHCENMELKIAANVLMSLIKKDGELNT